MTEKEDLQAAAQSRGLDDTGTIDELRARIDAFDADADDADSAEPSDVEDSDEDRAEAAAIVLPEYERQISEAQARADDDLIADLQDDYHNARMDTLRRRRDREAQREQDRREGATA